MLRHRVESAENTAVIVIVDVVHVGVERRVFSGIRPRMYMFSVVKMQALINGKIKTTTSAVVRKFLRSDRGDAKAEVVLSTSIEPEPSAG